MQSLHLFCPESVALLASCRVRRSSKAVGYTARLTAKLTRSTSPEIDGNGYNRSKEAS